MSEQREISLDFPGGQVWSDGMEEAQAPRVPNAPEVSTAAWTINRFINHMIFGLAFGYMRTAFQPPEEGTMATGEKIPEHLDDVAKKRVISSHFYKQFRRNTAVWIACMSLQDTLLYGLKYLRGVDDSLNYLVGGAAAGTCLGAFWAWNPDPKRILLFGGIGGLLGIADFEGKRVMKRSLLKQQQQLEQEVLKTPADQVRPDFDESLFRYLVALKNQQQLVAMGPPTGAKPGVPAHPPMQRNTGSLLPPFADNAYESSKNRTQPAFDSMHGAELPPRQLPSEDTFVFQDSSGTGPRPYRFNDVQSKGAFDDDDD